MKKIRKTLFTLLATAIAAGTVLPLAGIAQAMAGPEETRTKTRLLR